MINIVENTLKHIVRSSRRGVYTMRNAALYSTKKGKEGEDKDETNNQKQQENQTTQNIQTKQQQKPIDKSKLLQKFNALTKRVQDVNKQIGQHKDYEKLKAQYKKLNQDLANGRDKITSLINDGQKSWEKTKQKVSHIEEQQIGKFGFQLLKFNDKLIQLTSLHEKKQEDVLGQGIAMTSRILLNTLQKYHFKPYEPLKQKYNPKDHTHVEKDAPKDALIVKVVEPGWLYKNKVIRQAKVNTQK